MQDNYIDYGIHNFDSANFEHFSDFRFKIYLPRVQRQFPKEKADVTQRDGPTFLTEFCHKTILKHRHTQYKFHVRKPPQQRHLTQVFLFFPHQSSIYITALCAKAPNYRAVHLDKNTQCADTHRWICVAYKQNGRNKLFGRHTNRRKDNIKIDLTKAELWGCVKPSYDSKPCSLPPSVLSLEDKKRTKETSIFFD